MDLHQQGKKNIVSKILMKISYFILHLLDSHEVLNFFSYIFYISLQNPPNFLIFEHLNPPNCEMQPFYPYQTSRKFLNIRDQKLNQVELWFQFFTIIMDVGLNCPPWCGDVALLTPSSLFSYL